MSSFYKAPCALCRDFIQPHNVLETRRRPRERGAEPCRVPPARRCPQPREAALPLPPTAPREGGKRPPTPGPSGKALPCPACTHWRSRAGLRSRLQAVGAFLGLRRSLAVPSSAMAAAGARAGTAEEAVLRALGRWAGKAPPQRGGGGAAPLLLTGTKPWDPAGRSAPRAALAEREGVTPPRGEPGPAWGARGE